MRSTFLAPLLVFLLASPAAQALNKCKVKVAKSGVLLISASDVDGKLQWGWSEDAVAENLENEQECVSKGSAGNCRMAAADDPLASIPPPLCKLYLEDDSSVCTASIKGCVPGLRPGCPPGTEPLGAECIDKVAWSAASRVDAVAMCHAVGRSLCTTPSLLTCDSLNLRNGTSGSCGWYTDTNRIIWTEGSHESSTDSSLFGDLNCYDGTDNSYSGACQNGGSYYPFFCCTTQGGR